MSENAKNKLQELVRDLGGCIHSCINFQHSSISSPRSSSVMVTFPDGRIVRGTGAGQSKPDADIAAAQNALDRVGRIYPYLVVDWAKLSVEAQAGDALIKLGVYLSPELKSTAAKSNRLQNVETNAHLAKVFDHPWGCACAFDGKLNTTQNLLFGHQFKRTSQSYISRSTTMATLWSASYRS